MGLPNVGKSTLFNALLKKQVALAANYPFATIEPNVGVVPVPDKRLEKLAETVEKEIASRSLAMTKRVPIVPATVKFVDIAGLVKGASQGEGLGNKFLAHIREVDAICYVLRDFSDENVIRAGSTDPQSDLELLRLELELADAQALENRKARKKEIDEPLPLLRDKPEIVVFNTDENKLNGEGLRISAKLEEELAVMSAEEQKQYLAGLGVSESGLEKVIKKAYEILGLQSFLTAGEIEVRAWTIKRGTKAPQAAGVIHGDFEKHFIKADCVNYEDFINCGGWVKCRELGKVRTEGREYEMRDGDVVEFKVGV